MVGEVGVFPVQVETGRWTGCSQPCSGDWQVHCGDGSITSRKTVSARKRVLCDQHLTSKTLRVNEGNPCSAQVTFKSQSQCSVPEQKT